MAAPPLVSLTDATITFGGRPLFTGITCQLGAGERVTLVGRNGTGKSTLLKALVGVQDLDAGTRFVQPGVRLAYLPQEPDFGACRTVHAHATSLLPADDSGAGQGRVAGLLDQLGLDPDADPHVLSGGEARKADLVRVLASGAELLLLDEPTNHLDLPTIAWLEEELSASRAGLVLISHDRTFLTRLARSVWWLDRGQIRRLDRGFDGFEAWVEQVLEEEEKAAHKAERRLVSETKWLREGLSARRRRNQGRVRALLDLRKSLAERVRAPGEMTITQGSIAHGGSLVAELKKVGKAWGEKTVLDDVSVRVPRGARVGIIGANGAGKTTLLKILIGDLAPDGGSVRIGTGVEPVWLDQKRESLDPEAMPIQVLAPGSDFVTIGGQKKHVASYLEDFLFTSERARTKVKALSGGERARLLLARIFATEGNLLVLDEPTNDLDFETLDLLQEALAEYPGTVLLVSHDRDFLDRVATSVLRIDPGGKVTAYAGGYTDHLAQRGEEITPARPAAKPKAALRPAAAKPAAKSALTYGERIERDKLPGKIEDLTARIGKLEGDLAAPDLFSKNRARFEALNSDLITARADLAAAEDRWLELEMKLEEAGAA